MKDCVGKELNIGDKVICSDMRYADLLIGEIIGFTPKKARVRYVRSEYRAEEQREQLKETYQIFKYSESDNTKREIAEKIFKDLVFLSEDNDDEDEVSIPRDDFNWVRKQYTEGVDNET